MPWQTGLSYRTTGADLTALLAWQRARQAQPVSQQLVLNFAMIGIGAAGGYVPDTLTPVAQANASQFRWINHTYDHLNWDTISYTTAAAETTNDNAISARLGLQPYNIASLVTPAITGLTNAAALQAAYDSGVRQIVTDALQPAYTNPTPNAGRILSGSFGASSYRLLGVPRHPTNLYFNVSAPDQWLAYDNCLYPAGSFAYAATYQALLNRESKMLVSYLLSGDIDPIEFHALNVRAYDGTHSVLGDLLDTTLQRYAQLVSVPPLSMTLDGLANQVTNRMQFDTARASTTASVTTSSTSTSLQLTFAGPATVPVTGLSSSGAELYAGQPITRVTATAAGTQVISLSGSASPNNVATLNPVQDTFISRAAPTSTAGGTSLTLSSDLVGSDTAFVRFDLSTTAGKSVSAADLRLHTSNFGWAGSAFSHRVSLVGDNGWQEQWMSYTNTVPISTTVLGTFVAPSANTWYDVNLDPVVVQAHSGGLLSVAVEGLGGDVLIFDARESGAATAPQLVLTTH